MVEQGNGYEYSIISFDPMQTLLTQCNMTDLQLARKIGEKVDVVRNIQLHSDTTTIEVIRKICEVLKCHPGDIMERKDLQVIPAKKKDPSD